MTIFQHCLYACTSCMALTVQYPDEDEFRVASEELCHGGQLTGQTSQSTCMPICGPVFNKWSIPYFRA